MLREREKDLEKTSYLQPAVRAVLLPYYHYHTPSLREKAHCRRHEVCLVGLCIVDLGEVGRVQINLVFI